MDKTQEEKYTYNRIVIIGNGFDIACGMKTSYDDFILDYVKENFKMAFDMKVDNSLMLIENIYGYQKGEYPQIIDRFQKLEELEKACTKLFKWEYTGELIKQIFKQKSRLNWVDIESLYFQILISKIESIRKRPVLERDYSMIVQLNKQFEELLNALERYIIKTDSNFKVPVNDFSLMGFITKLIKKDGISNISSLHNNLEFGEPEKILFVNFNYTKTLEKIIYSTHSDNELNLIQIHGVIENVENPVIFGYGDDLHSRYQEIEDEDEDNNSSLNYIKTFYYSNSTNYLRLIDFILDKDYEVYVVGHSCGLSDRTLLNTIFEDSNCKLIKIFHYGDEKVKSKEDHFQKTIAVSRHCINKPMLRKRIVTFDKHAVIPQLKKQ
jgi:Bacteriophage abortive infection AbiH